MNKEDLFKEGMSIMKSDDGVFEIEYCNMSVDLENKKVYISGSLYLIVKNALMSNIILVISFALSASVFIYLQ